jgi:hypothetical protein
MVFRAIVYKILFRLKIKKIKRILAMSCIVKQSDSADVSCTGGPVAQWSNSGITGSNPIEFTRFQKYK